MAHTIQQGAASPIGEAVQRLAVSERRYGVLQRDPDDSDQSSEPDSGQAPPDASTVPNLDQEYSTAVQMGDWQAAAEWLNAFNREDIQSRLAALSSDQVAKIHQGALDNPKVGPKSQVAQLTESGTPPASTAPPLSSTQPAAEPSAAQQSADVEAPPAPTDTSASQPMGPLLGGVSPTMPGPPGSIPPGWSEPPTSPEAFKFPKISKPFPVPSDGTPVEGTVLKEEVTGRAVTIAVEETGIGAGATAACVVGGLVIGLALSVGTAYVISHAEILSQNVDPDELSLPGGVRPQSFPGGDGDAGAPMQLPPGQTPTPATDPSTGQPLLTPGTESAIPAQLPGQPDAGEVLVTTSAELKTHLHHVFPQQFFDQFLELCIDVDDFVINLEIEKHIGKDGVHVKGKYNKRWEDWFEEAENSGKKPTKADAMDYLIQILNDLGLQDYPIGSFKTGKIYEGSRH